jgi:hypothetical protein
MDKLRPLIPHQDWGHNNFMSVRSFSFKIVAGNYARPIIETIIKSDGFNVLILFLKTHRSLLANAGLETNFANREMTDEEKRRFFNFD